MDDPLFLDEPGPSDHHVGRRVAHGRQQGPKKINIISYILYCRMALLTITVWTKFNGLLVLKNIYFVRAVTMNKIN